MVWPLAPQFQNVSKIFYVGPICSGHWLPVTSLLAHTPLIPAQPPPLPVFSFLFPVVPPECMPKLQFSRAKSQKLMQEKEEQSANKPSKNVPKKEGAILQSLAVLTEMRPCTPMPDSFSRLLFVVDICRQDAMWLSHQSRISQKLESEFLAPLLQLFLHVLVQPFNISTCSTHHRTGSRSNSFKHFSAE